MRASLVISSWGSLQKLERPAGGTIEDEYLNSTIPNIERAVSDIYPTSSCFLPRQYIQHHLFLPRIHHRYPSFNNGSERPCSPESQQRPAACTPNP
jgi:hypothetical protein